MMTIIPTHHDVLQEVLNQDSWNWFDFASPISPGSRQHPSRCGSEQSLNHFLSNSDNNITNINNTNNNQGENNTEITSFILQTDLKELKLHYIQSHLAKILPSLEIKTTEDDSTFKIHIVKSVNSDCLNIINSYYLLSLCVQQKKIATDPTMACMQAIYRRLNFNFNDYKLKLFAKNKSINQYSLIIHSASDNLNKIFSFNDFENLNFNELIIDKTTLINKRTNMEEIRFVITIPKINRPNEESDLGKQVSSPAKNKKDDNIGKINSKKASLNVSRGTSPIKVTKSLPLRKGANNNNKEQLSKAVQCKILNKIQSSQENESERENIAKQELNVYIKKEEMDENDSDSDDSLFGALATSVKREIDEDEENSFF